MKLLKAGVKSFMQTSSFYEKDKIVNLGPRCWGDHQPMRGLPQNLL